MISLADFTLERVTVEVRYDTAFLYWDNSGKVLAEMAKGYADLQIRNVNLSNVACDLWTEGLSLYFDSEKAYVSQEYPDKLDTFCEFTTRLLNLIQKHLQVQTFTRVGCRPVHSFHMKSPEEATALMRKVTGRAAEDDRLNPFGTEITEVLLRVEDESRGHTLHVSNMPRKVPIKVSRPLALDVSGFDTEAIVLDVDAYTKKIVVGPQLDVRDFVAATLKNINGNLFILFGW